MLHDDCIVDRRDIASILCQSSGKLGLELWELWLVRAPQECLPLLNALLLYSKASDVLEGNWTDFTALFYFLVEALLLQYNGTNFSVDEMEILGWPKSSPRHFCTILWKNMNELFGQPNTLNMWTSCMKAKFPVSKWPKMTCHGLWKILLLPMNETNVGITNRTLTF